MLKLVSCSLAVASVAILSTAQLLVENHYLTKQWPWDTDIWTKPECQGVSANASCAEIVDGTLYVYYGPGEGKLGGYAIAQPDDKSSGVNINCNEVTGQGSTKNIPAWLTQLGYNGTCGIAGYRFYCQESDTINFDIEAVKNFSGGNDDSLFAAVTFDGAHGGSDTVVKDNPYYSLTGIGHTSWKNISLFPNSFTASYGYHTLVIQTREAGCFIRRMFLNSPKKSCRFGPPAVNPIVLNTLPTLNTTTIWTKINASAQALAQINDQVQNLVGATAQLNALQQNVNGISNSITEILQNISSLVATKEAVDRVIEALPPIAPGNFDCDSGLCSPKVTSTAQDLDIQTKAGNVLITTKECGTVDLCVVTQALNKLKSNT